MDSHPSVSGNRDPSPGRLKPGGQQSETDKKLSFKQIFSQISDAIANASEYAFLTYSNIDPKVGSQVVDSLNEDPVVERVCHRYSLL
jgi:hypothetical protein